MLRDVPPLLLLLLLIWFAKKSIKGKSVSMKQLSYNLVSSPPHESTESFSAVAHPVIENIPSVRILKMNLIKIAHCGDYASFWVKNMLMWNKVASGKCASRSETGTSRANISNKVIPSYDVVTEA